MSGGWPDHFDPERFGVPQSHWSCLPIAYAYAYACAYPAAQHPEHHCAAWLMAGGYLSGAAVGPGTGPDNHLNLPIRAWSPC